MDLRRTQHSIQKKLRELGSSIFEPIVVAGPQELPPGLRESLFEARLAEIWDGLLKLEMTQTWRDALQEKPPGQWLAAVSAGIPAHVKRMLGGLQSPSWEELKSSALVDTKDAGVYARLVESRFEIQAAGDRRLAKCHRGSAAGYCPKLHAEVSSGTHIPTGNVRQVRFILLSRIFGMHTHGRHRPIASIASIANAISHERRPFSNDVERDRQERGFGADLADPPEDWQTITLARDPDT